ncbi:unnamed protein product [Closterium sp. Naga37s-1]|nr:unnamed protein product [Closterium sp. Naga37s-1]
MHVTLLSASPGAQRHALAALHFPWPRAAASLRGLTQAQRDPFTRRPLPALRLRCCCADAGYKASVPSLRAPNAVDGEGRRRGRRRRNGNERREMETRRRRARSREDKGVGGMGVGGGVGGAGGAGGFDTSCDQRTYPYLVPPNPFPPPSSLPFSRPSLPSKLQEQQDEKEEDEMVVMESVNGRHMAMQHMLQGANTPCPPGPHLLCSLSQPSLPSNQQGVDEEGGDEEDDEMVVMESVNGRHTAMQHMLQGRLSAVHHVVTLWVDGALPLALSALAASKDLAMSAGPFVVANVQEVLALHSFLFLPIPHTSGGGRRARGAGNAGSQAPGVGGGRRLGGAGHAGRQAAGVSNLGMEGALQLLSPFSFPYLPFVVPPYPHTSGGGRRGGGAGHAGRQARGTCEWR